MKIHYDSEARSLRFDAQLTGVTFDRYIDIATLLRTLANSFGEATVDPLDDATRPGGTPASERHRELENVAEASEGRLTVTHTAGGQPILVAAEDAPVGLPVQPPPNDAGDVEGDREVAKFFQTDPDAEERAEKLIKERLGDPQQESIAQEDPDKIMEAFSATMERITEKADSVASVAEEMVADLARDELEDLEQRAQHAQRYRGVAAYKGQRIVGFAVKGDSYHVVLELDSGVKVTLDEDDNELRREQPTDDLPQGESRDGDFKPEPEGSTPPADAEAWPDDLPASIKSDGVRVREIVQAFVDRSPAESKRGTDFARDIVEQVVGLQPHLAKFASIQPTEVRRRVIQLLAVIAVVTHDESESLKAEMGVA